MRNWPKALLGFGVLVYCATPSLAGTWTQVTTLPTGVIDNGTGSGGPGGASGSQTSNGTDVSFGCHVTGSASITFTWVPASGQDQYTDPPPQYVVVSETAGATATCTLVGQATMPGTPPQGPPSCFVPFEDNESSKLLPDFNDCFREMTAPSSLATAAQSLSSALDSATECGLYQTVEIGSSTASCSVGNWGTDATNSNSNGGCTCGTSGSHYEVKASSSGSFTVTSPTLSATVSGDCYWYATMQTNVYFTALASNVSILLNGTTPDSSQYPNIMAGQGCSAQLLGIPSPVQVSSYAWTVSGDTFGGMCISNDQSTGYGRSIDPITWTQSIPFWYWLRASQSQGVAGQTVSCTAQLTYTDSNGLHTLGTISPWVSLSVWNPYFSVSKITLGTVGLTDPTDLSSGANGQDAFSMLGAVSTPDLMRRLNDSGQWGILQLCKLYRDHGSEGSTSGTKMSNYELDSAFPYNESAGGGDSPGDLHPANDTLFLHLDTPSEGFDESDQYVTVHDTFKTYMMYLPPNAGNGTTYVPLYCVQWGWDATMTKTDAGAWTPSPPGTISLASEVSFPDPPSWNDVFRSGN